MPYVSLKDKTYFETAAKVFELQDLKQLLRERGPCPHKARCCAFPPCFRMISPNTFQFFLPWGESPAATSLHSGLYALLVRCSSGWGLGTAALTRQEALPSLQTSQKLLLSLGPLITGLPSVWPQGSLGPPR